MSEIVSDLPHPGLGEHRLKVALVEVVGIQNRSGPATGTQVRRRCQVERQS